MKRVTSRALEARRRRKAQTIRGERRFASACRRSFQAIDFSSERARLEGFVFPDRRGRARVTTNAKLSILIGKSIPKWIMNQTSRF